MTTVTRLSSASPGSAPSSGAEVNGVATRAKLAPCPVQISTTSS
ncbi:hypothetical protein [Streptomyces olivochromogenes]